MCKGVGGVNFLPFCYYMEKKMIDTKPYVGNEARTFLDSQGYIARTPSIRSSDYELLLHCPFQYYLSRRLGLIPKLQWSQALSHGSWFHTYMEYFYVEPAAREEMFNSTLDIRCQELEKICNQNGIIGDSRDNILGREKRTAQEARAWAQALYQVRMSNGFSFYDYCNQDYWKLLGTEVAVKTKHTIPRVALFDVLLYHRNQNSLWIIDYKTTGISPDMRLETCPIEFQSRHYSHILEDSKDRICKAYDIPKDVKIGGIIHVAIQKPTIKFGVKDRDYELDEKTITRGPRKGMTIVEKKYYGEPRVDNYIKRCKNWYAGEGDYLDKKPERESNPPIALSACTLEKTDRERELYEKEVQFISLHATQTANPDEFMKSSKYVQSHGTRSPYADFYFTPTNVWPELIEKGFSVHDRDNEIKEFI